MSFTYSFIGFIVVIYGRGFSPCHFPARPLFPVGMAAPSVSDSPTDDSPTDRRTASPISVSDHKKRPRESSNPDFCTRRFNGICKARNDPA